MASFVYNANATIRAQVEIGDIRSQPDQLDRYRVELLDWPPALLATSADELRRQAGVNVSIRDLFARDQPKLRIIFAPLDLLFPGRLPVLKALYNQYDIPTEFISERINSVTNSFGAYESDETYVCWSHSLCKNVQLKHDGRDEHALRDPRGGRHSQGDGTWLRSGYFLKWKPPSTTQRDDTEVLLIVFGVSPNLEDQLKDLVLQPTWAETLVDPLNLFVPVLDSMFTQINELIFKVLRVVSAIEEAVLDIAGSKTRTHDFDFVGMHNIMKHITYLKESSHAAVSTATRICEHHQALMARLDLGLPAQTLRAVHELLLHKQVLLDGCILRVGSVESRMQNMINLAFNTVSQRDSLAVRADSRAMKAIAVLTMLFLPVTAVATIFGSSYFALDASNKTVVIADSFRTFWIITIPLTVGVFAVYGVWHWHLSGRSLMGQNFQTLLHMKR